MKPDSQLLEQVFEQLRSTSRAIASGVNVTVTDGVVLLSGSVASYAEKRVAAEAARRGGASGWSLTKSRYEG